MAELKKVAHNETKSLYEVNREVYELLKYGKGITLYVGQKEEKVYFIDYDDFNNNDFYVAEEVTYKATDKFIKISDTKTKFTVDKQSNVDTIVISRLGVLDSEECMECVKELQDWGFFVLNPIQAAQKASNKYTSSVLLVF